MTEFSPCFTRIAFRSLLPLALALATLAPAAAVERGPYSLEILVDGVPRPEYGARRTTYIEAVENHEYSIRLRNHTGRRIAVALSVDGLNTIDAKTTTASRAAKWILGPYETVVLDGWQTGPSTARRFFFTTEEKSYGAWLGKTRNLGNISAVVFREKTHRPVPVYRSAVPAEEPMAESGRDAPAQPGAERDAETRSRKPSGEADRHGEPESALSEDFAATGIGRKVDHRVRRVRFDAEDSPAAVMELRYEYRDVLASLGVLPPAYSYRDDPLQRRERSRGFEDLEFAPDPFVRP